MRKTLAAVLMALLVAPCIAQIARTGAGGVKVTAGGAAWASIGTLGTAQSATDNQASVVLTTSAAAEVGNVVVVTVATDNGIITDNDEIGVSSLADSSSNVWRKAREFSNGQGNVVAGAMISIWFCKVTTEIANGGTITATFRGSANRDAAAINGWEFSVTSGFRAGLVTGVDVVDDAVDPSSIAISGLSSEEYLWVHALAGEGPNADAFTWDADYTQLTATGTTGGAATDNIHLRGGFRIFTGTDDTVDVTSDTADRDYVQGFVALKLVSEGAGGLNTSHVETAAATGTTGTTQVVSFVGTPTPGNLIVASSEFRIQTTGGTITGVTDNQSNTYQLAVRGDVFNTNRRVEIWYAMNVASSGTFTVTFTFSATTDGKEAAISEYSGALTASTLDTTSHLTGSSIQPATNPATPAGVGLYYCALGRSTGTTSIFSPASWNLRRDPGTSIPFGVIDQLNAVASPRATWFLDVSRDWGTAIAVFKD